MLTDYKLNPEAKPSEREVFIMSRRMEKDGHTVDIKVMRALMNGDIKYVDGKVYRFCIRCVDYYPLDRFNPNGRYIYGKNPVCKECMKTERRIKRCAQIRVLRDSGMRFGIPVNTIIKLKPDNMRIFRHLMEEDYGEHNN